LYTGNKIAVFDAVFILLSQEFFDLVANILDTKPNKIVVKPKEILKRITIKNIKLSK
jgi:hypothetical protein